MPPRIPTEADFAPLATTLPHALHFPSPRESTRAFLILFHGFGDSERPFAAFARSMALPGVLAIAVRGTAVVPASLLGDDDVGEGARHFHWGDDVRVDTATGGVDADAGFERAMARVMDELVRGVLVARCGWQLDDVLLLGFGQGGSLALGLASAQRRARGGDGGNGGGAFKGVVSLGGPLPPSTVPSRATRAPARTPALVCQLDDEQVEYARRELATVDAVRWRRPDVAMPRDRDEALPMMRFFAERLGAGW